MVSDFKWFGKLNNGLTKYGVRIIGKVQVKIGQFKKIGMRGDAFGFEHGKPFGVAHQVGKEVYVPFCVFGAIVFGKTPDTEWLLRFMRSIGIS